MLVCAFVGLTVAGADDVEDVAATEDALKEDALFVGPVENVVFGVVVIVTAVALARVPFPGFVVTVAFVDEVVLNAAAEDVFTVGGEVETGTCEGVVNAVTFVALDLVTGDTVFVNVAAVDNVAFDGVC